MLCSRRKRRKKRDKRKSTVLEQNIVQWKKEAEAFEGMEVRQLQITGKKDAFAEIEDAVAEITESKQLLGKEKETGGTCKKRFIGKHPDSIRQSSRNTKHIVSGFSMRRQVF